MPVFELKIGKQTKGIKAEFNWNAFHVKLKWKYVPQLI